MTQSASWFQQTPSWVWWSCFPVFGGLAITYAGHKSKTRAWLVVGVVVTGVALVLSSSNLAAVVWLGQIGTAFYLKKRFLVKTYPKTLPLPEEPDLVKLIANSRPKIDINDCSKNDLVNGLGIPIVYANNIESLLNEGYGFTHLEELTEIAGIPENQVKRIAPLITFSYNYRKEAEFSWKRVNTFSTQELIECGLDADVAQKITEERQRRGEYSSLMEVKRRTGLPFSTYRHIA